MPKYQRFVAKRGDKDYYVRGTFTKENLDFTEDVLHMASLGFDQISVEPVVSDPSLPFSIREEDLPRVFEEYDKLAKVILERKKPATALISFTLCWIWIKAPAPSSGCAAAAAERICGGGSVGRRIPLPPVRGPAGMADGECSDRRI